MSLKSGHEVYNLNKQLLTTLDLNMIVIVQNYEILIVKDLLIRNQLFCKIFPFPEKFSENCEPIIVVSAKDKLVVEHILDTNNINYELIKIEKDIVGELLAK